MANGIAPSDRVGILASNSLFWVAAYLATMKLGAVAVPFATLLMPDEVSAMERFVGCKVICAERRLYRRFAHALRNDLPIIFDEVWRDRDLELGR